MRNAASGGMQLEIDDAALEHLVTISGGDARMALSGLEAAALAAAPDGPQVITLDVVADAVQRKAIVYDRQGDAHYDVVSAFIKSIRGSDPDAALFWLARMLEAGEDPRFIVRRLIVHASEDVGLADPMALLRPRPRPPTPSSTSASPRHGSTWRRRRSIWRAHRNPTASTRRSPRRWRMRRAPSPCPRTCATRRTGRAAAWSREGVHVSARLARPLGRTGVPAARFEGTSTTARRGGRGHVARAARARTRRGYATRRRSAKHDHDPRKDRI